MKYYRLISAFSVAFLATFFCACSDVREMPRPQLSSSSEKIVETSSSEEIESSSSEVIESSSVELPPSSSSVAPRPPKPVPPSSSSAPDLCASAPNAALCDKRDGRIYRTVRIGGQVWMAENLKFQAPGSWCYEDKAENCSTYGRLYKWTTAVGLDDSYLSKSAKDLLASEIRGICPEGWHVPTSAEMKTLYSGLRKKLKDRKDSVVEGVGTSLKKKDGWEESDEAPPGTDRFGFGAVPGGYRNANGVFNYLGQDCNFWVASEASEAGRAPYWNLYFANEDFLGVYNNVKSTGYSLRCVKNAE